MKLNARHLTVDLYNCKNSQLTDIDLIKETLKKSLSQHGASLISLCCEKVEDDHYALIGILEEGHISLQVYSDLKYVAMDIFLCKENAQPEAISKAMRSFFKPDKTKTTLLKPPRARPRRPLLPVPRRLPPPHRRPRRRRGRVCIL